MSAPPEVQEAITLLVAYAQHKNPGLFVPDILRWHLSLTVDGFTGDASINILMVGARHRIEREG